jgi:hypothetical protein
METFNEENKKYGFEITYFEARLKPETVDLAMGYDVVCVFVNDEVNETVVKVSFVQVISHQYSTQSINPGLLIGSVHTRALCALHRCLFGPVVSESPRLSEDLTWACMPAAGSCSLERQDDCPPLRRLQQRCP